MSVTVFTKVDLEAIECANCGVIFGITTEFQKRRRENHSGFYCPNGHSNYYPQKTEAEELRDKLEQERRKLANAQFELMAAEKKIKRIEKRVRNGVCPCCDRQFVQLARHMKTKHPEYVKEK